MNVARLSVLATAVAALSGAAISWSEPPDPRPGDHKFPISIAAAEAKATEIFDQIDADDSGTISSAEFAAADMPMHHGGPEAAHRFRHHRWADAAPGPDGARGAEHEAAYFQALDSDGNGQLSPEEFSREHRQAVRKSLMRSRAFEHMDADHNGELSRSEFPARIARLKELDADGNGEVSRDELRDGMRARHQEGS